MKTILKRLGAPMALALLALGLSVSPAQAGTNVPGPSKNDKATVGVAAAKGKGCLTSPDLCAKPPKAKAGSVAAFTTCPAGGCFSYVGGSQAATATGAQANFMVGNPTLGTGDAHSLAELAVQRQDGGGVDQNVEVGWTKDPSVCSATASKLCLFVFSWKNGVANCYNGCGWVDYAANTTWNAGSQLTAGDVMQFRIQYDAQNGGAWWVWVGKLVGSSYVGDWLGYFPLATVWSGVTPAFTNSNKQQYFWELSNISKWESCGDMGNGAQGSGGAAAVPRPAYIASATLINGSVPASLSYYRLPSAIPEWTQNTPSDRTQYGGGPGWNSAGTGVGTSGAC